LRSQDSGALESLSPGLSGLGLGRQLRTQFLGADMLWMRLGPDEWWCWRGHADAHFEATVSGLSEAIAQATAGLHHACVDLSDAYQSLLLSADAWQILSFGCDLDWQRLPPDLATRTRLASWSVVLAASGDRGMALWVDTSLSLSLQHWLEKAEQTLAQG
jgi:sarcosine oxidase gamma subunit